LLLALFAFTFIVLLSIKTLVFFEFVHVCVENHPLGSFDRVIASYWWFGFVTPFAQW